MELQKFLKAPENTRTRERIFFHRVYFDMKMAAARQGYHLGLFEPDVDRDGFDVVLDDRDSLRQFQLKSATRRSKTNRWRTTLRFLRPTFEQIGRMHFEFSPRGEGRGGGIIVMLIDDSREECPVTYLYTDLYVICSLWLGVLRETKIRPVNPKRPSRRAVAEQIMLQLHGGGIDGELILPRKVFLEAKSPASLLALMGFHSSEHGQTWAHNLSEARYRHFETDAVGRVADNVSGEINAQASTAAESLVGLISEPGLAIFEGAISSA